MSIQFILLLLGLFDPVERKALSQFELCYFAQDKLNKFKFCMFTRFEQILQCSFHKDISTFANI